MLEKAAGLDVAEVVIDLEDSVRASRKTDVTRRQAVAAISRLVWRTPAIAVRINAVGSPWFRDDVDAVVDGAGSKIASIVLPKVESADSVLEALDAIDRG